MNVKFRRRRQTLGFKLEAKSNFNSISKGNNGETLWPRLTNLIGGGSGGGSRNQTDEALHR